MLHANTASPACLFDLPPWHKSKVLECAQEILEIMLSIFEYCFSLFRHQPLMLSKQRYWKAFLMLLVSEWLLRSMIEKPWIIHLQICGNSENILTRGKESRKEIQWNPSKFIAIYLRISISTRPLLALLMCNLNHSSAFLWQCHTPRSRMAFLGKYAQNFPKFCEYTPEV